MQAGQLCAQVDMYVGFPERRNKSVTLSTSEAEYVALGDVVKDLLLLRQVWRFMLPGKGYHVFLFLRITKVLYNSSRRTQCRTQIQNTLTFAITFYESLPTKVTLV